MLAIHRSTDRFVCFSLTEAIVATTLRGKATPLALRAGRPWLANSAEVWHPSLFLLPFLCPFNGTCLIPLGRKMKCDGRPICANCNKRGIACSYVPV